MSDDIKICRIVTGETIVGKRVGDVITDCLLLQAMPIEGNQVKMGISPYWAPYCKDKADIHIDHCMIENVADPELASQYQQITSGIVIPTAGDMSAIKSGPIGGPGPGPGPGPGLLNLVKG